MKKKTIATLLTVALAFSMFGCGAKTETAEPAAEEAATEATEEAAAEEADSTEEALENPSIVHSHFRTSNQSV